MTESILKSYAFRRERERTWQELEALLGKAEKAGLGSLSSDELLRLPSLYRATVSSLSVARSISLDKNVVHYLESLAARAYFHVYGARAGLADGAGQFFSRHFPRAVRAARWHIVAASLALLLGLIVGLSLTLGNEDWYYAFVPDELAKGRSPMSSTEELRAILYETGGGIAEELYAFASFLFTHNAMIGMLCFALGFALGVPVLLLMFYNGLILGSLAAIYEARGLSAEFWAWIGIHGSTELLAVVLCGGAGLVLASSLAFPGRYSRLDNLARNGRSAARIVMGAVVLFLVASLLEGAGRQLILDVTPRYLVALGALLCWVFYLARAGRHRPGGAHGER